MRIHISLTTLLIPPYLLFLLWLFHGFLSIEENTESIKYGLGLFFWILIIAFVVAMILWFPICLIQKPDRIEIINLLNKRFRKDVIWHSDVLQVDHYTQLKWGREARYIRFLMKDGSYQLYGDYYLGTRNMIERWKRSHGDGSRDHFSSE